MELRNLKTFQVVANELNMTKAAKILKYTQPTITLQIQVLEREINHSLFTRIGKKTFLTPAGKKLKQHTDRLFELMEYMERDMEELNGPSGSLTVTASEYYCTNHLSLLLSSYTKLHKQVKLRLMPANSLIAVDKILNNEADIGIVAGEVDSSELEKFVLEREKAVLVVSADLAKNRSKEEVIESFPFLAYHEHCGFSSITEQCFSEINTRPSSTIECGGSDETIRRAVLNKTGIALLGENMIKEELAEGILTPLHYCEKQIETSVVYLKSRSEGPTVQSFCELLKETWFAVTE
ncbi:LysR family transcriptional regulator [Bacillus pumilus]|uniref:LysR family transcriptional regulator n=1 Tax=Bacillus pumilus TaxID=1408 RepID=UPI00119DA1A5|nr:LysR family transcriptional regulator [Bacillus pumilus]